MPRTGRGKSKDKDKPHKNTGSAEVRKDFNPKTNAAMSAFRKDEERKINKEKARKATSKATNKEFRSDEGNPTWPDIIPDTYARPWGRAGEPSLEKIDREYKRKKSQNLPMSDREYKYGYSEHDIIKSSELPGFFHKDLTDEGPWPVGQTADEYRKTRKNKKKN